LRFAGDLRAVADAVRLAAGFFAGAFRFAAAFFAAGFLAAGLFAATFFAAAFFGRLLGFFGAAIGRH
jgi:hypothetical protein